MSYTGNYNQLPPPPASVQVHGADVDHQQRHKRRPVLRCLRLVFGLGVVAVIVATLVLVVKLRNDQKNTSDNVNQIQTAVASTASLLQALVLPRAYVAPLVPPRKYQEARGTCWDFGTIGPIEHQYRQQAVAAGLLPATKYVKLSEQAYGNRILYLCNQNQGACLLPGDNVAFNSTEGGETTLLWSFQKELSNAILPDAVCPYINNTSDDQPDSKCPGIEDALKANPIKFTINSLTTLYDLQSIKEALVTKQYSMGLSTAVWYINFYLPCTDKFAASDPQCLDSNPNPSPCPNDVNANGAMKCLKMQVAFNNMEGEFTSHHQMDAEAGHAMTLVGYSDSFVSKDGYKGGLIVRNTWRDGVYSFDEFGQKRNRGSHSLPYFLQFISEADEHLLCPNSYNPRNWYTCGNGDTLADRVADCMSSNVKLTATAQLSPLELQCAGTTGSPYADLCQPAYNTWWAANFTQYFDGLYRGCFIGAQIVNGVVQSSTEVCLTPMPLDMHATVFNPQVMEGNYWDNDDDYCGFYFYPYAVWEQAKATFNSGFVQDYQLTFDLQSFQANAAQYSNLNYTLLASSTHDQKVAPTAADMPNAYPNANAVGAHMNALRSKYQDVIRQKKAQSKLLKRATKPWF